jgi:hypothetical protein
MADSLTGTSMDDVMGQLMVGWGAFSSRLWQAKEG